jgi:pimeloyl-ACP methyl ester carboxylesterase
VIDASERRLVVERDGVKLAVRDFGGDGRAVLGIHGLASSSHIWDLVAADLVPELHVVAYDQRGHGESSKPTSRYGFEHTAADAAAVIRELRLGPAVAIGHSWGGNVALELGVREPSLVSGLILLDGGFMPMGRGMDWQTAKQMLAPPPIAGMKLEDYLGMLRQFMGEQLDITPEVEHVFLSLMRVDREGRIRPRLSRSNHLKILRALWEQDPIALLRRVTVPTLVVATRRPDAKDQEAAFIDAKDAAAEEVGSIGGPVRFQWIEGIHDVPLQHPDAVAELIRDFATNLPTAS